MHDAIPIISLAIALMAVVVGPWVQSRNAKRQLIAPMRQAWINSLRDNIAELCGRAYIRYYQRTRQDVPDKWDQLEYLNHRIRLMLNMTEEDHQALSASINTIIAKSLEQDNSGEFTDALESVHAISSLIFKTEWNRVKSGK